MATQSIFNREPTATAALFTKNAHQ